MIFYQLNQQLQSLRNLLLLLNNHQYQQACGYLGNASIGGHSRHIIELLKCAVDGYTTGTIDYVNRARNLAIEQDTVTAINAISDLTDQLQKPDKNLQLLIEISDSRETSNINTNYFREIVYNAEHAVHHLALIKVALKDMNLQLVAEDFGMAYSTIKYKATQNS